MSSLLIDLLAGFTPASTPCAECTAPVPPGTTYCSSRCRNAADRHDDMDGDL